MLPTDGATIEPGHPAQEALDEGDRPRTVRSTGLLRFTDIDPPTVGADDVLVRIHAASLNPADWHIVRGDPKVARLMGIGLTKPKIPVVGTDAAGVVETVGANVRGLQPGDEVFGFVRGAFAEYACAKQDQVVPKPASLTFEQAAALPIAATTALRGIRDVGAVKPGQRVLVNGASGGVGSYAVQIAAARRRRGHRRVQHGERRARALARRRARHRLHHAGLHRRGHHVRRDPRQREQPPALTAARRAHQEGNARAQRWRFAGPRLRADRHLPEGGRGQPVRLAAVASAPVEDGSPGVARRDRARRGREAHLGRRPDLSAGRDGRRACATWSRGTSAAKPSSPWRETDDAVPRPACFLDGRQDRPDHGWHVGHRSRDRLGLAAMGASVAITGRDRERAERRPARSAPRGGGQVDVFVADLSSQSEVRRLADEVLETFPRLDVLVNNVGGYWNTRHVTADGLERTFALNHLAPFLLTDLLLDRMKTSGPARVVTVASGAHATGRIDFDDLQGERSYSGATGVQPVQARERPVRVRAGRQAAGQRRNVQCGASWRRAHIVRSRGSRGLPAAAVPGHAAVHEEHRAGRRDVDPRGVVARARACDGAVLRRQQAQAILEGQPRRGHRGASVAGECGTRRPAGGELSDRKSEGGGWRWESRTGTWGARTTP